jgi:hypothetical protein
LKLFTEASHPHIVRLQDTLQRATVPTSKGGVLLTYAGELDNETIEHLLALSEQAVNHTGGKQKLRRRVGSVLIECLQNVIHHGWPETSGKTSLYLTLELTPFGYQIQCGNVVDLTMSASLREKLAALNNMSHEELRKAYVETLCEGEVSEAGGAGLGLISMAKKTKGPLDFQFEAQENNMFLFTLSALVKP